MLLTTPVLTIFPKYSSKLSQVSANGARPDSGNANTEFSRAEWKPVSTPWMYGDDADSAMKCGMKRDIECSRNSALFGSGTADVHVLAEHRELLREIAVEFGDVLEARRVVDLAVAPLLERMRAAAAQPDVELIGRGDERVADLAQIGDGLLVRRADAGRQLDHAFGDLRRDVARDLFVLDETHQVGRGAGQVVVVRVDDLDFQLDAERERFGVDEGFECHDAS